MVATYTEMIILNGLPRIYEGGVARLTSTRHILQLPAIDNR